jgi:myosin heavy subunit
MNPTERVISVAMDTLIIGSALPGKGAIKAVKGRVKEGIAELKAQPEAGAVRFDNTKPVIELLEVNGVRVSEALKGDIRTTLKNLENSVMVKDEVAILKNASELKKLAAKLEDAEVRDALTKYADKLADKPDTYIKVADSAGKSPKRTEDAIKQNREVVEQLGKNKVITKTIPKIEGLEDIKISRTTPEQRKAVFDEINKALKRGTEKRKIEAEKKIREKAKSEQESSALKQKQGKEQKSAELEKEIKRVSEEAKKHTASVGDANRQIREGLKRIKEEKASIKADTKAVTKTVTKLRAAVKQATNTETKTALKQQLQQATETNTALQQQLKLQTETKAALSQALKTKTDVETKLEVATILDQMNKPSPAPAPEPSRFTKPKPEEPVEKPKDIIRTEKVSKERKPEATFKRRLVSKLQPGMVEVADKKRTAAELANAVTWKQGIGYWIVYPDNSAEFSRTKPDGVREVPGPDKNKPGATIQVYKPKPGGRIRQTTGDMGIQDVTISRQGIKPVGIRFKGDRKQQTTNPVKFGKHKSIKKNHVYYTRIGRGDIISREPLQ